MNGVLNMKNLIKKIFGIDEMEKAIAETQRKFEEAEQAKKEVEAKLEKLNTVSASPLSKEEATKNQEPWVAVLDTKINKDNVRNGFFELDWNEYFVVQLKLAGYSGSSEEQIVDAWFQDLCRNIGAEQGVDMERRGSGYINVNNIGNGKSEIS